MFYDTEKICIDMSVIISTIVYWIAIMCQAPASENVLRSRMLARLSGV